MPKAYQGYGSLIERISRIFFSMDDETTDKVLQAYRQRFGDGAYAYARRTIESWKEGKVRHVGQTAMRLLEVVPIYADQETKFELVRLHREETLRRLSQKSITLELAHNESTNLVREQLTSIIKAQLEIQLPPDAFISQTWLTTSDVEAFQELIREAERSMLVWQLADFLVRIRLLQHFRSQVKIPVEITAYFELPTAQFTLHIVGSKKNAMHHEEVTEAESGLLAKWQSLEMETRFQSGQVSYPEYVLRNMDKFFTPDEQSELHKIAAMHGLELERLLMEINIKSRTSEADLQKLLNTLNTLKEKGIAADVVSRHETPSGHIEITARSRRRSIVWPWSKKS